MQLSFGSLDVEDLFRPKPVGEPVNIHVVEPIREPQPDFDAMRRLIEGDNEGEPEPAPHEPARREIPEEH